MRTTSMVVVAVALCLALAPCVPARLLPPSFSAQPRNLVNTRDGDPSTTPTPLGTHLEPPSALDAELRRSLKNSGSKGSSGSKSKPSKPKKRGKSKLKGGTPSLIGVIVGSAIAATVLSCAAYCIVTEKRPEDPNWRVHTFLRRKLKRKYTFKAAKKGAKKGDDVDVGDTVTEKLYSEHKVAECEDLGTDPPKKV